MMDGILEEVEEENLDGVALDVAAVEISEVTMVEEAEVEAEGAGTKAIGLVAEVEGVSTEEEDSKVMIRIFYGEKF